MKKLNEMDMWMLSRVESLVKESTANLDNYEPYKAAAMIKGFVIEDFSRFYLKMAKKRMGYVGKAESKAILDTISYALYNILVLTSVVTPFVAESVYRERFATQESIFLEKWPKHAEKLINKDLEENMEVAQETITAVLSTREKLGTKLRQPLSGAVLELNNDSAFTAIERLISLVEDYTNIRKIEVKMGSSTSKEVRPMFENIGPEFKASAGAVGEALKTANAVEMLKDIESNGHYSLHTQKGTFNITEKHFTVIERALDDKAMTFKYGVIHLNTEIDEELREEALVREFERKIQLARKGMQLKKADRIKLHCRLPPDILAIVNKNKKKIMKNINAKEIGELVSDADSTELEVDEEVIKIKIEKLG